MNKLVGFLLILFGSSFFSFAHQIDYADKTIRVFGDENYWKKQVDMANRFGASIKINQVNSALNLIKKNGFEFRKMPYDWKQACSYFACINKSYEYFNYMFGYDLSAISPFEIASKRAAVQIHPEYWMYKDIPSRKGYVSSDSDLGYISEHWSEFIPSNDIFIGFKEEIGFISLKQKNISSGYAQHRENYFYDLMYSGGIFIDSFGSPNFHCAGSGKNCDCDKLFKDIDDLIEIIENIYARNYPPHYGYRDFYEFMNTIYTQHSRKYYNKIISRLKKIKSTNDNFKQILSFLEAENMHKLQTIKRWDRNYSKYYALKKKSIYEKTLTLKFVSDDDLCGRGAMAKRKELKPGSMPPEINKRQQLRYKIYSLVPDNKIDRAIINHFKLRQSEEECKSGIPDIIHVYPGFKKYDVKNAVRADLTPDEKKQDIRPLKYRHFSVPDMIYPGVTKIKTNGKLSANIIEKYVSNESKFTGSLMPFEQFYKSCKLYVKYPCCTADKGKPAQDCPHEAERKEFERKNSGNTCVTAITYKWYSDILRVCKSKTKKAELARIATEIEKILDLETLYPCLGGKQDEMIYALLFCINELHD